MTIDCGLCDRRGAACQDCQDCVVTIMAPHGAARHLDTDELRALGVLADAGMIPPLRLSDTPAPDTPMPGVPMPGVPAPSARKSALVPRAWAFPAARAS